MSTTPYVAMCEGFAHAIDFDGTAATVPSAGSPFDSAKLIDCVATHLPAMPDAYQVSYGQALQAHLPRVCASLEAEYRAAVAQGTSKDDALADAASTTDALVGAVRDWAEPPFAAPLRRFEAVVSNLYRSFLGAEQRAQLDLPLKERMPPLATFAPHGADGPFTLPVDQVKPLVGCAIGIVSLPASYRGHPLLWPALAHETGGHDVVHADVGLRQELADGVRRLTGLPPGAGALWAYWMDEAVADVYGLLNVGPSFALSLAAYFSAWSRALGYQLPPGGLTNQLSTRHHRPSDEHPVDLLRLYLAEGATGQLTQLSGTALRGWRELIAGVADEARGGATSIDFVDEDSGKVLRSMPLQDMAEAARRVGAYIAGAKLRALGGHSIQDIETWDDVDDDAAAAIRRTLADGKPVTGLGDDAQLLAGATMAYHDAPKRYAAITGLLEAALDDSFDRDPVFGRNAPRFMMRRPGASPRGKSCSRTFHALPLLQG